MWLIFVKLLKWNYKVQEWETKICCYGTTNGLYFFKLEFFKHSNLIYFPICKPFKDSYCVCKHLVQTLVLTSICWIMLLVTELLFMVIYFPSCSEVLSLFVIDSVCWDILKGTLTFLIDVFFPFNFHLRRGSCIPASVFCSVIHLQVIFLQNSIEAVSH